MEALSIQAVEANTRPAGTQAQGELGDIFQALLRDSLELQEMPELGPRTYDRPEQDAPQRSLSDERVGGAGGDRRDRFDDRDTDYRARDVPNPSDHTVRERDTASNTEPRPRVRPSTASDRPPDGRDTPAPDDLPFGAIPLPVVDDRRLVTLEPTRPVMGPAKPIAGNGGQGSNAAVLPGASGKTAGVPQAVASPANQAQNPVSPLPSSSAGGNGFSVRLTVTPAQVVATPNAGLGGGAATAAIAAANTTGLAGLVTENTKPGTGASAASIPNSDSQSAPAAGRQTNTLSISRIAPADGQALAAQTENIAAAAAAAQKQDAGSAGSETRNGATLNSPLAKNADRTDAPIQSSLTQNGQAQGSGSTAQNVTGQNISGQGDGTKAANAQNQQAQSAPQVQTGQVPNATVQTGGATASAQGSRIGERGAAGGSTGSTDAASSRAASVSTVATSGFTQAIVQGPYTLGSLTRSGGTQPSATNQVAVEIQKAVNAGKDQIRIRLHPAELGQIDVTLKVRHDGTVKAIITIDRPETFDLMQRDARGLDRALQDAGLKTDSGSLTFTLRGGDQQTPNDGQRGQGLTAQANPESDRQTEIPSQEADTPALFVSDHALDIRV